MEEPKSEIRISYITGLNDVVSEEIRVSGLTIRGTSDDSFYVDFAGSLSPFKQLRSASRAYLVVRDTRYHPTYINNHKSILGALVDVVISEDAKGFKSFKLTCAGSDSPEARGIARYIAETYKLSEEEDADLKIHIIKQETVWEVGVQITPRPLSVRAYKVRNMEGAMDPTIAYATNSFCNLENAKTYLNIFSGSGTLLIEAGQCYKNLEKLVGFDNNKKHLSLAVQNIKEAGLTRSVQLFEDDIFGNPDLGKFDAITSDLPFGMSISKGENLNTLYKCFIEYCEETLISRGRLVVYTNEHKMFKEIISKSKFKIVKTLRLEFMTNGNQYLHPKILVCTF
ncbi:methyltransferase [Candidatus Wolfebacteria bacterium]|nr:methyltransferase [Candidatus Wolfebacteria bacterium]